MKKHEQRASLESLVAAVDRCLAQPQSRDERARIEALRERYARELRQLGGGA